MVRLTADLLSQAPSFLNPLNQRELYLRGHNLPAIENLGITRDQNEAIDFTDNDVRHLGNFPKFVRLKTLLCARNRISSISPSISTTLPNLETLVVAENQLTELTDLDALRSLAQLQVLVCRDNPVARNQYYRAWMIWRCPTLRILDYKKIKARERLAATELFGTEDTPTPLAAELLGIKSKTFEVSGTSNHGGGVGLGRITEEEKKKIKIAIMNAGSMAEVQRLESLLMEGRIPDAHP